jgi:uncharacterized protein YqgV (UPF0045/DUF77 family)
MTASIDISYYPLSSEYRDYIIEFIQNIKRRYPAFKIETNGFSTQIFGNYDELMQLFQNEIKDALSSHKCVFVFKIAPGERTRENLPENLL